MADIDPILALFDERLTRFEGKLDAALGKVGNLDALHRNGVPHYHTALDCPIAAEVKLLNQNVNRAKGALFVLGILALPGAAAGVKWIFDLIAK